jgi:Protein of unknown function (DUF3551)
MKKLLTLSAAVICCAAVFGAARPAAAKDYEYCRRDVSSYMLSCGFETLAQCQDMSFGRGGDCIRNSSLGGAATTPAYAPIARTHRQK